MAAWVVVVTWTLVVYNASHGTTHIEEIATAKDCSRISREYALAVRPNRMACIAVPRKVLVYR